MKVAVSFPGCHRRAGVERVMVECLNFLAARGHDTHALASEWDRAALRPEVVCHQVPARALLSAGRVARFRRESSRALDTLKPDVTASFGVAAAPGSVVWMQSVHAAWLEVSRRTRTTRERLRQSLNPFHPMILRAEKQMLRAREYRRLIALTPEVRDDLVRFYGVPAGDVEVLPNGFSPAEFNPQDRRRDREAVRGQLGIPREATVVLFVANEAGRKGLPQLLRAVSRLRDKSLHVLAVGRFDPAPSVKVAALLGLGDRTHFHGASAQVARFYAAADVFALPTQYEAWGLVIVEAMACGLPVLTSKLAGAAVAVQEGWTGELLDDPRDETEIASKLDAVLDHRLRLGDAEISRSVARYAWPQILSRYEQILCSCARLSHAVAS